MKRLCLFIFAIVLSMRVPAMVWTSINIDMKTTEAMTAAYVAEYATEVLNDESIRKILDHYSSAEVATAGIFASKWLDRQALQNAGLFSNSQENFYYRRIYEMVSARIMPKIMDVAALMIKNPDKALYWGPYLYKVCEDTRQLCMVFETVVCNGKVSFQDIAFLAINDQLKGLFDLTKLGEVDWRAVWDKLADFGSGITKEDLMEDLDRLMTAGGAIASAGVSVLDSVWTSQSHVGELFHATPAQLIDTYYNFKELYNIVSNPMRIRQLVMEHLGSTDSLGVAKLFTFSGYNITSYVSDYINELQGRYFTQRWYIYRSDGGYEHVEYEEVFDSQTMDNAVMQARFNARLAELNANEEGIVYYIGKGEKHYYQATDEVRMRGCCSASFTLECHDSTTLGEGSFSWKENGDQKHALDESSKRYAMETTLSDGVYTNEIDEQTDALADQVLALQEQISTLESRNNELYAEISRASIEDSEALRAEYQQNLNEISRLKSELSDAESLLSEYYQARYDMMEDYNDEIDGYYRIPAVMHELEAAYRITWADAGYWDGYTFIRHGNIPGINAVVTFQAELMRECPERWFLGFRIHRCILGVHWKLTGDYDSSQIVDVMELDPGMSDADKAQRVNDRMRELMQEFPLCSVEVNYAYASPPETEDDEDAIHLLWVCDRLKVARDVDYRLSRIYAQLILVEKFLRSRETTLDYLKRCLGVAVVDQTRKREIGDKNIKIWKKAARIAARGGSIYELYMDDM